MRTGTIDSTSIPEVILSTTKPTVRSDGSPLQHGDTWLDTSNSYFSRAFEWFWCVNLVSGTNAWISAEPQREYTAIGIINSSLNHGMMAVNRLFNLFLLRVEYSFLITGAIGGTENIQLQLSRLDPDIVATAVHNVDMVAQGVFAVNKTYSTTENSTLINNAAINLLLDVNALNIQQFRLRTIRSGASITLNNFTYQVVYHLVHP